MKKRLTAALLAAGMTLSLTAPVLAAEDAGFADVPAGVWYEEAVLYCRDVGLMAGTSAGIFSPEEVMTRSMFCTVLHRAAGSPPADQPAPFSDVPADSWYGPAAAWAAEQGLMNSYGDGSFHPSDPITREQLAAVLWRSEGAPAAASSSEFADKEEISSWAADAVDWAREHGILSGTPENLVLPKASATRAEAAQILMNYTLLPGTQSVVSAIDVLCRPSGIAPLEDGGFLVTDSYHKVIWQVQAGISQVYAGLLEEDSSSDPVGGYNDGPLDESLFLEPWALAPFLGGWAVSDPGNQTVRLLLPEGTQTLNCSTKENLKMTASGVVFERPTGLAADGAGNLYIADTGAGAVRQVTPQGDLTTLADGLQEPMGLCWLDGALYVAETGAHRVLKITPNKTVAVAAGAEEEGLQDGPAAQALLSSPQGVAAGPDGTLYIADTGNSAIRCLKDGQVTTLYARDLTSMELFFPISPTGMMVYGHRLFVCDSFSRKVVTIALE